MSSPLPSPPSEMNATPGATDSPPTCRPPAKARVELAKYDRAAEVGTWNGPRYRMTYRTLGQGPPLIWVPGIATTYRSYAMVLNLLSERFQTIQYSYPGDAPDGARLGRISHEDLAADLFGLIDHLGLGRVYLAGLSFGSTVALKALAREPRRFPRAVLQGAFAHRRFTIAERAALFIGRRFPGTLAQLPMHEAVLSYNCRSDFPALIGDRWDFHLEQHRLTPIRALAHRAALLTRLDLRPILPTIATDVLLIQGREDRVVPASHLEVLRAGLPRVETAVMPTVGHIPHMTHVDSFARLIGDWLLPCAPEGCAGREAADGTSGCALAGPGCPGAGIDSPCAGPPGGHELQ